MDSDCIGRIVTCTPSLDLGLDPADCRRFSPIKNEHGHYVCRLEHLGRSYVLKCFGDPASSIELVAYRVFEEYGVPTLPVRARTDDALLLEDLITSQAWRLGEESDVNHPGTGAAVAAWYHDLHRVGRAILADPTAKPEVLKREADALNSEVVLGIGERLEVAENPVWHLAAEAIESLKVAMRSLPETLDYNDFHWTNLALSRSKSEPLKAVVFDYHLLGIGLEYSDCRNVLSCLRGQAAAAFKEAYGPANEMEVVLDAPVSVLYALHTALSLPNLPSWAESLVAMATSGALERSLRRALQII